VNANLAKLGDELDTAEREWIETHPHRSPGEAICGGKVGDALDRYRAAVRADIGKGKLPWMVFPPIQDATSLRDLVDKEAQRVRECHSLKLHWDFQDTARKQRGRKFADDGTRIVFRSLRRRQSVRSVPWAEN